jgi:ankyrin repeat protein
MKKLFIVLVFIGLQSLNLLSNPLHFAAESADIRHLKLLTKVDIDKYKNELNNVGDMPIHCAARCLNMNILSFLLKQGVSINSPNARGETVLSILADSEKDHSEAIRFVLSEGADINAKIGDDGYTPLHYAVKNYNYAHVATLLEYADLIDISIKNRSGRTALMLANCFPSILGMDNIIELLSHGPVDEQQQIPNNNMDMQYTQKPIMQYAQQQDSSMQYPQRPMTQHLGIQYSQARAQFHQQARMRHESSNLASEFLNIQVSNIVRTNELRTQVIEEESRVKKQLQPVVSQEPLQNLSPMSQQQPIVRAIDLPESIVSASEPILHPSTGADLIDAGKEKLQSLEVSQPICKTPSPVLASVVALQELPAHIQDPIVSPEPDIQPKRGFQIPELEAKEEYLQQKPGAREQAFQDEIDELYNEHQLATKKISKHQLAQRKKAQLKVKAELERKKRRIASRCSGVNMGEQEVLDEAQAPSVSEEDVEAQDDSVQVSGFQASNEDVTQNLVPKVKKDLRLHKAIESNQDIEAIKSLITLEALTTSDNNGNFPLHLAAIFKNLDACREIIHFASTEIVDSNKFLNIINAKNNVELVALHYAVIKKSLPIADYLLSKGANLELLSAETRSKLNGLMQERCKEGASAAAAPAVQASQQDSDDFLAVQEPKEETKDLNKTCMESCDLDGNFIQIMGEKGSLNYKKFIADVISGKIKDVERWITSFPDFTKIHDNEGMNALHVAVINNDGQTKLKEVIQFLIGVDPKAIFAKEFKKGYNPLEFAISLGEIEICKCFLSKLLSLELCDPVGFFKRYIKFATERSEIQENSDNKEKIEEIVTLLKANFNTCLQDVMLQKKKEEVQRLISGQPAQPSQSAPAASSSSQLYNKYSSYTKEYLGSLLFTHIKSYSRSMLPSIRQEIIEIILAGADLTKPDITGLTYLHKFAAVGDVEIVRLLAAKKANPEAVDELGNTPLHVAIYRNREGAAAALIYPGINLQIKNKQLLTPLLLCVIKNKKGIYNLLMSNIYHGQICWPEILKDAHDARAANVGNEFAPLDQYIQEVLRKIVSLKGMIIDENYYIVYDFSGEDLNISVKERKTKKSDTQLQITQ